MMCQIERLHKSLLCAYLGIFVVLSVSGELSFSIEEEVSGECPRMLPDIDTLNTGPATLVTCQARLGQTNNWTETCKILPRLADILFKTS